MKFSVKITESNQEIEKAIATALLPQINKFMSNTISYIKSNLFEIIKFSITNQPEYESLINGNLKFELGINNAEIRVSEIIDRWINNAIVNYKPPKISNNKIKSNITIKLIQTDFSDVLNLSASELETEKGQVLPWLQWLLLEGSSTIVKDYEVYFGPNARSRTGFAIMSPSNASGWNVPSEYAGTLENNWITRAIDSAKPEVQKLLEQALSQ